MILLGALQFSGAPRAEASIASDFNPGNIISDSLFYDGNALTAGEVQSFLNQRVPTCTLGTPGRQPGSEYYGTTLATACLKSATFSTATRPANAYCKAYVGSSAESAASVIAKVAQSCGISAKVLLVMLEKEQSLVTDTWPTVRQYNFAMGYACPDSGPNNSANCDPSQTGFMQQVYRAAWQLKVYRAHPANYNYRPGWNNIQWHPNAGCGTSRVYIENDATAALYIYTPYRPNQAALDAGWGTGDGCSSYGNRNFYLFYKTWFGATHAITHASLDSASGEYGGIRLSGWARKLIDPSTAYVWANVYDTAGNLVTNKLIAANQPLAWFNDYAPGWGNNHGFNDLVATAPGTYRVDLFNTSVNSEFVGSRNVTVPIGQGHVDSVAQTFGGIRIKGWSVDFRTGGAPDTIRVVVDGKNPPLSFPANVPTSWIGTMFPGMGNDHAFDFTVPASTGKHTVCVYGAAGLLDPCSTITLGNAETGSVDTITQVDGGVRVTGWAVNLASADPSSVDITLNGRRVTGVADRPISWFNALFPGAGNNHGFDIVVPEIVPKSGSYEVCAYGKATGKKLSCKNATLLGGEVTSFDSATASIGQIRITGWSAVLGRPDASYIWVNVDGVGKMYGANTTLSWFNNYAPGSGNAHGFDISIPSTPGAHEVCVFTARTGAAAGCKTVQVPKPQEQGSLDGVTGEPGMLRAWGWSHVVGQPAPSYVWVDVNGAGKPYRADVALSWFEAYAPGQGPQHGFDVRVPVAAGTHRVCVSGMTGPTSYGCRTVTVP